MSLIFTEIFSANFVSTSRCSEDADGDWCLTLDFDVVC
jgi:hypothetical protein